MSEFEAQILGLVEVLRREGYTVRYGITPMHVYVTAGVPRERGLYPPFLLTQLPGGEWEYSRPGDGQVPDDVVRFRDVSAAIRHVADMWCPMPALVRQ